VKTELDKRVYTVVTLSLTVEGSHINIKTSFRSMRACYQHLLLDDLLELLVVEVALFPADQSSLLTIGGKCHKGAKKASKVESSCLGRLVSCVMSPFTD